MKHEFNNCAAWAKGWYKRRPNIKAWWMDLAHCINNDGWCCVLTKNDVVQWILHRFDEDQEWWRQETAMFNFSSFYSEVNKIKNWYSGDDQLSTEDAIIIYFRDLLSMKSKKLFEGGYRPSNKVLPLTLHPAYHNDGTYNHGICEYEPAEMMCDAIERINNSFKDLPEQEIQDYYTYDHIESSIRNKDYRDVKILVGSDAKANLIKTYTGKELYRRESITLKDITDEYGCEAVANLGVFSYSIGFDDNKNYNVYIEVTNKFHDWGEDSWTETIYTVKNIKEQI